MNTQPIAIRPRGSARLVVLLVLSGFAVLMLCLAGLASCFFLGSDARTLRNAFFKAAPAAWHQKVAVNIGPVASGAVRLGSRFFKTPPEARAGIAAFRGAEVGIYRTSESPRNLDVSGLAQVDKAMARRGWHRIVKVMKDSDLVMVFLPAKSLTTARMRCCFLVAHGNDLVVGSARCDLDPVLNLPEVRKALDTPWSQLSLARGN